MYKKTFHGGVHPYDGKEFARDIPFQKAIWFFT